MKSLTNLTDQQLIHLFMDGDAEALESLIHRHKDKIYTSIFLLVKDKYLAEDIFQDVFIRVIDTVRSGRYTEEGKFLPWAMRIAHNLCVDHFRKVKRTPTVRNSEDRDIFEVLNITANVVGNVVMEKAIRLAMQDIEKGDGISVSLGRHPVFPVMIIRMLTAGEQTGKIDAMLERVADFLDDEIETILGGLTSLIEPLLIVFLGVVVGGIVICMFLPIFKMSDIINPPGR